MRKPSEILVSPILSEKSSDLKSLKKYVVEVVRDANKIEVKYAIEEYFKVKVEKVNMIVLKPKKKRIRYKMGYTKFRKKAIITLRSGELDFYKV